ncbi:chorismate mutase [Pseudogracilibacillus auburnensis]|uniref:chorismate mutase n=1 Tax=Pseudogracilibacillus auburnensis TaxID=1494959 RepID=A0A2V3W6H8_9BACI|nr:chorismate mutase [Pseudogracilibacillus auburnensis]MBO1003048.1 chorismate mutase [Pseudogracilibacillus auburnensis]PXW88748.1 chorismate mutase [Pseudogracilibacillus auburnensis]
MIRGFRGATTVTKNDEAEIMKETKKLVVEMVEVNNIEPSEISHVLFSVTDELNAGFPAKVARQMSGWTHVPVMCMKEIDVPNSLERCVRVMLVAKTNLQQDEIIHVFLNDAVKLRPDLIQKEGE